MHSSQIKVNSIHTPTVTLQTAAPSKLEPPTHSRTRKPQVQVANPAHSKHYTSNSSHFEDASPQPLVKIQAQLIHPKRSFASVEFNQTGLHRIY